ncbi:MAG: alkaline phosphatase family protein [Nocardioides sp.]|nr:alkaline phosphatase family protein [Nocardioides sp.]
MSAATAGLGMEHAEAVSPRTRKRAYVFVIDGCKPEEIDAGLTPHLMRLRDRGMRWSRASSMPIMETIPNHVMMMTGVRPDRSGVPANSIYDRSIRDTRTLDRARDLGADTILQRLNRQGLRTATVLSKEYLYGIFGPRAKRRWEPFPIIPVSGHAPDEFTMRAATAMVEDYDPHLMFVNLGDIDRYGHTDLTGPTGVRALRNLALAKTDNYIAQFTRMLVETGRWKNSMMIVLADHSMDWSYPHRVVSLQGPMDSDPFLAGKVAIGDNGGADLLYWLGPAAQREKAVRRMQRVAARVDGVHAALPRTKKWMRLGPEAGDVVVFCKKGWRFSDPDPVTSNPIPGNHGHLVTRSIPFFITGGHRSVQRGVASADVAHTVDVAPTVADFFGVKGSPRGGWDGRSRL